MCSIGEGSQIRDESGAVVGDVQSSEGWRSGVVAPVYSVFVGKQWEYTYPDVLGKYYDSMGRYFEAVRGVSTGGIRCGVDGSGFFHAVGCSEESGWRKCIGSVDYDAAGFGVSDTGEGLRDNKGEQVLCDDVAGTRPGVERGGFVENHGVAVSDTGSSGVSVTPRWREKKNEREKRRKERRRKECEEVVPEVKVGIEVPEKVVETVPEWRRKGARVFEARKERGQLSKFQDCEESVRKSLVETQAKRYIAENEAAVVRAKSQALKMEEESRRVAARLKAGVTEQYVELQRLNLNEKMAKHAAAFYGEQGIGFAETVISEGLSSVLSVPSSGSECVSPDSSVSVAMVKKMEKVIKDQSVKVAELERKLMRCGVAVELDEVHIMTGQPMDALGLPIEEVADEDLSLEDYQATNRAYL